MSVDGSNETGGPARIPTVGIVERRQADGGTRTAAVHATRTISSHSTKETASVAAATYKQAHKTENVGVISNDKRAPKHGGGSVSYDVVTLDHPMPGSKPGGAGEGAAGGRKHLVAVASSDRVHDVGAYKPSIAASITKLTDRLGTKAGYTRASPLPEQYTKGDTVGTGNAKTSIVSVLGDATNDRHTARQQATKLAEQLSKQLPLEPGQDGLTINTLKNSAGEYSTVILAKPIRNPGPEVPEVAGAATFHHDKVLWIDMDSVKTAGAVYQLTRDELEEIMVR